MFDFDVNEVDTSLEMKGEFPAVISTIKKTATKATNKPMIAVDFKIIGDKYKGSTLKTNYVIDTPTSMGTKLFFNLVDMLSIERGSLNSETGLKQFIGKDVNLKVGKKKKDDQYSSVLSVTKPVETTEKTSEY